MNRLLIALALSIATNASAQTFPAKPIRFVVPFPPGGGNDVLARITGAKIAESIGQAVVIENRPGASGQVGTEYVQRQAPDGYTIITAGTPLTVTQAAGKPMPYDVLKDFTPISLLVLQPNVLVVHPSLAVNSLTELVALAKVQPGKLNIALGSSGSAPHLASELLKSMAAIDIVVVPYNGAAPALRSVLANEAAMVFDNPATSIGAIRGGTLRALGVTGRARAPQLPDVPAIGETLAGYEVNSWFGVVAPANLSKSIADRLSAEFAKALKQPDVQSKLTDQGFTVVGSTPEAFSEHLRNEIDSVKRIFTRTGLKLE